MSEHRETSSRSLAPTTQLHTPHSQSVPANTFPAKDKRRKRSSTTSNGTATETKLTPSRRRSGNSKTLTAGTDADSFPSARRSTTSPNNMSTVNYTKTGRVSKAKKGLKVHDCECGRVCMLWRFCRQLIPCCLLVSESMLTPCSHTHEQNTSGAFSSTVLTTGTLTDIPLDAISATMLRRVAWSVNSQNVARRSSAQIFSSGTRSDSTILATTTISSC